MKLVGFMERLRTFSNSQDTGISAKQIDLHQYAKRQVTVARNLARLLACGTFHDLSAADFSNACEAFDMLLSGAQRSLLEMERRGAVGGVRALALVEAPSSQDCASSYPPLRGVRREAWG